MRKFTAPLVLALVLALYAAANSAWFRLGTSLYGRDVAGHLLLVEKIYYRAGDCLRAPSPLPARAACLLGLLHEPSIPFHHTYIWPKLVHAVTALACAAFGLSPGVMLGCSLAWLAILVASVCLIGRRCGSPFTGLCAALLVSAYPAVYGQTRKFGLDFPLTAMTALNILMLLRAERFDRTRDAAFLGATLGLGILTKGQIVLYLAAPAAYAAARALAEGPWRARLARAGRMALAAAVAGAVSAVWWWGIAGDIWRAYYVTVTDYPFSWGYAYQKQPAFTAPWLFFHAVHCAISVSPFFFVLFLAAAPSFIRSRFRERALLALWLLGGYAVWTLSNIKRDTDFYPCLPAVALMTAAGMDAWRPVFRRRAAAACLIAGVAQFVLVSFSTRGYGLLTFENPYGKPAEPDGFATPFQPPYPNNYREVMERVAAAIREAGGPARYARIGVVETSGSDRWQEYSTAILEFYFRLRSPDTFIYRSRYTPGAFLENGRSFDYLLVMDRRNGPAPDWAETAEFFSAPRHRPAIRALYGDGGFGKVLESYRTYPQIARMMLAPEGCGVYVLRKPPVEVRPGEEFPASGYRLSDLATTPAVIGARGVPRLPPLVPDYDSFFPYWLRFPLVDGDLRRPGDPYFSEYALDVRAGGVYRVSARCASPRGERISVFWDGTPAAEAGGAEPPGADGPGTLAWRGVCVLAASPGVHTLRLQGDGGFPLLSAIRFDGDEPAGHPLHAR